MLELATNHVNFWSVVISVVALGFLALAVAGAIADSDDNRRVRDWLNYLWVIVPAALVLGFVWSGTFRQVIEAEPLTVDDVTVVGPCHSFYEAEDWDNYDACIDHEFGDDVDRMGG